MMSGSTDTEFTFEYTEPSIKTHEFSSTIFGHEVGYLVLKMEESLFIWIGSCRTKSFNDLTLAIQSKFDKFPSSSHLLGANSSEISRSLSIKLAKKLNKPVYLSYNVSDHQMTVEVMKRLLQEIENNTHCF